MATHPSILAWRIPWTEETVGDSQWGPKKLYTTEQLTHTHTDMVLQISFVPSPSFYYNWGVGKVKTQ